MMKTITISVMFCTSAMDRPGGPHISEHTALWIRKRRSGPHYQPHPPAAAGSPCSALVPQQCQFLRFSTYSHLPLESHMEFIDGSQVESVRLSPLWEKL
ncbi:hypothetical protein RRG08_050726 [Elysia crispata]|uniref:Uncharacterized protein n=1 Tax=Elysia crispata TaxID=231223 RepID=A0AAE1EDV4_9GAST|nr:hypothetical protein RRG08_050726 [Elysia crispata]